MTRPSRYRQAPASRNPERGVVEIYSEQRVAEFERENAVPDDLQARVRASLSRGD